ncbi:hypothetical protein POM88_011320 [Heracleum sosnowskyi]|uniref:Uncharacterized protein n=1 Tax=Heracleum sosnowskyi TaxID=360622 RepID=A0AAD8IW19_9APIA|nr:hypothetical protein POM88_011320 [Heracleum sosnowskyi]
MAKYFENVLSVPFGDASVGQLKSMPLSEIAANEEHFRGLIDWVESHRPREQCARSIQPYLVTQRRLLWSSPRPDIFRSPKWTLVGAAPHLCLFSFLGAAPLDLLCQCPML